MTLRPHAFRRLLLDPVAPFIFPELRLCRNDEERHQAERLLQRGTLITTLSLFAGFLIFLSYFAFPPLYVGLVGPFAGLSLFVADFVLRMALFGVLFYGSIRLLREPDSRRLRAFLRSRGIPICAHCGYDIAGLRTLMASKSFVCPECGAAIPKAQLAAEFHARKAPPWAAPSRRTLPLRFRFCRVLASDLTFARTDFERDECLFRAGEWSFVFTIALLIIVLCLGPYTFAHLLTLSLRRSISASVYAGLIPMAIALPLAFLSLLLYTRKLRRVTRAFLRARGVPL